MYSTVTQHQLAIAQEQLGACLKKFDCGPAGQDWAGRQANAELCSKTFPILPSNSQRQLDVLQDSDVLMSDHALCVEPSVRFRQCLQAYSCLLPFWLSQSHTV